MRTGCNVCPQSSTSGCGSSRNCVSTVPTEPAAGFDADVVIVAIISLLSYDPWLQPIRKGTNHDLGDCQQRSQRPGAARRARGAEGRAGGGAVHVAGGLQVAE